MLVVRLLLAPEYLHPVAVLSRAAEDVQHPMERMWAANVVRGSVYLQEELHRRGVGAFRARDEGERVGGEKVEWLAAYFAAVPRRVRNGSEGIERL